MKKILYNDFFMPNRYKEYESMLKKFKDNDYEFICIKDYKKLENKNKKYIIIRHDVDSDVKIAKKMFEIEKKLEIKTTFYFRLSTINKKFMHKILEYGSEVGYHYEEIAEYCKENNNISKAFVDSNLEKIKEKFIANIRRIENKNNIKLFSIASHGDFINRKLDIPNQYIYQEDLKNKLKLLEAYDIEEHLDFRTADEGYPNFWKKDPIDAIRQDKKKVLILVHTRWWDSAPLERIKLNFKRLIEEIAYNKNKDKWEE